MSAAVRILAETSAADPDVARFTLDRDVSPDARRFDSVADATGAPLALALFALDGVRRVALLGPTVTVGKAADAAWPALKPAVAAAIRAALPAHDAAPVAAAAASDDARLFAAVQAALDGAANPAIARHGGRVDVVSVQDGDVRVRMSGGCQGCAASSATLRDGVERILRTTVPGIRRIIDATDHAAGKTPYLGGDAAAASPLAAPTALSRRDGAWTVDATHLAARFGVTPEALQAEMQAGRVASRHEVGEGADSGKTRLTIRWGHRVWRALIGADGAAREEMGEAPPDAADDDLAARVRDHLMRVAPDSLPMAYGALAEALDVRPPHAIARIARALETTMRQDAAAGRPFIAALVIGRARGGIPAPGFFALASALGRGPGAAGDQRAFHARAFAAAMAMRDAATAPLPKQARRRP